jgi:hypothetical protein
MSNIYVIASHVQHANERIQEIRAYRQVTQQETLLIPVLREADMRGRKVDPNDTVVVCGDWSSRQAGEVQHLVAMFNSRRDGDRAPELRFRIGEAPEVVFPVLAGDAVSQFYINPGQLHIDPGNNNFVFGIETTVPPVATTTSTTTTSAQVAWDQVLDPPQQRIVADAQDAAKRERAIAADMRAQVKKAKAEVKRVTAENQELREWLSGVLPVEDPDLPGLFYCGICSVKIPRHTDGCPAAPA